MWRPIIYIGQILEWADAHKKLAGRWPRRDDGKVVGGPGLTWNAVDLALSKGNRGLPKGSTLAKLLHEHRGKRHPLYLQRLTVRLILTWADAHHERTGQWPGARSGPVLDVPGETWQAVERKLQDGGRGLRGGSSIAQVLERHRGVRNRMRPKPLTEATILRWVDAFHMREGRWPTRFDGPIPGSSGETWHSVHGALMAGTRGLPPGGSLARLLDRHRGVRNNKDLPDLTLGQVLAWAKAYHARTGKWPNHTSGPIPEAPGETWAAIHAALVNGRRGFAAGSSLYQVLWHLRPKRRRNATAS